MRFSPILYGKTPPIATKSRTARRKAPHEKSPRAGGNGLRDGDKGCAGRPRRRAGISAQSFASRSAILLVSETGSSTGRPSISSA